MGRIDCRIMWLDKAKLPVHKDDDSGGSESSVAVFCDFLEIVRLHSSGYVIWLASIRNNSDDDGWN